MRALQHIGELPVSSIRVIMFDDRHYSPMAKSMNDPVHGVTILSGYAVQHKNEASSLIMKTDTSSCKGED